MTRLKQFDTLFLFHYRQYSIGSALIDHVLEKSGKAKTEVYKLNFFLMLPVFDRLNTGLWQYDLVREREERSF